MRTRTRTVHLFIGMLALGGCDTPPVASPDDANTADKANVTLVSQEKTPQQPAEAAEAGAQAELPAAEAILAAALEAEGGRAKINAITSFYSESKFEVPSQNLRATNKLWWRKGEAHMEIEMPGMGKTVLWASNGEYWMEDPISGLRQLTGAEAKQAAWSTSLSLVASWKDHFSSATTQGRRVEGDRALLDVLLKDEDGTELTLSFDEKSKLLASQSFRQAGPMGEVPVVVTVGDYKDHDGYKRPTVSTTDMKIMTAITTELVFKPNVSVADVAFTPPRKPAAPPKK